MSDAAAPPREPPAPPAAELAERTVLLTLADPVARVPGVGTARGATFSRLGVATVGDLLRLAPRRFEDRRATTPAALLVAGAVATWTGRVVSARTIRARRGFVIVEAVGVDETGEVRARWFNQPWIAKGLTPGTTVLWHGSLKDARGRLEFAAPAVERVPDDPAQPHPGVGRLVPVHPGAARLSPLSVRRAVWTALERLAPVPDPLPLSARAAGEGDEAPLPSLAETFARLHFPERVEDSEAARARLAFEELLVHECLLARRRAARASVEGVPLRWTRTLDARIRRRLPFRPTEGQEHAIREILRDLAAPSPMNRLLQGDVGCGKTAVAAYACLVAVANRRQAAFMAPTELLARQHAATLAEVLEGSSVRVETLLGSGRGKPRKEALARIARGDADLVVGTHALLSAPVEFAHLALVVVDEQHKFGVRQRRALVTKGPAPHCLVMTATPIPRTLAMTAYGELAVTVVHGRPPGAGRRTTRVVTPSGSAEVLAAVREALARGEQAFVVFPLVEESDKVDLRDATRGAHQWQTALAGFRVGLVHGAMTADARAATMDAFRRRRLDCLVATVVVEVGIDVPNATVLVVEHAERFGLSQLHQLRGRVGRGPRGGRCFLMDRAAAGTPARLEVLAATEDGFEIAEEDLRLRGGGDLFGTRQHGMPAFFSARLPDDLPLLERARRTVARLLEADPALSSPEHAGLAARVRRREADIGDPTSGG